MSAILVNLYDMNIPIRIRYAKHTIDDKKLSMHSHEFMELVIVTQGSASHIVRIENDVEMSCRVESGSIFLLNIGEEHSYQLRPGEQIDLINIVFDPTIINSIFYTMASDKKYLDFFYLLPQLPSEIRFLNTPKLDSEELKQVEYLCLLMNKEEQVRMAGTQTIKMLLLSLILTYAGRMYGYHCKQLQSVQGTQNADMLRVIGYLQRHFCDDISLDKLASIAMCSQRHLTRQFKALTGETVSNYIHQLRIEKACGLLRNSNMKVKNIAMLTGFGDVSYFHSTFRKRTGFTPMHYRKQVLKE